MPKSNKRNHPKQQPSRDARKLASADSTKKESSEGGKGLANHRWQHHEHKK